MFGCAIGSIIAMAAMIGIVEGSQLFRSTSTEMIARDKGAKAIRQISIQMQDAYQILIYPNYLSTTGTASTYGTCGVIQTGSSSYCAFYLYPTPPVPTTGTYPNPGGIYYRANAATAPNPATDTLLVQDFEFRQDPGGTVRAGFKIAIYGFPTLALGAIEPNVVRFSTSNLPRN
jgi:hypothetical protein